MFRKAIAVAAILCVSQAAKADISYSASVLSDYRYRGISFSDGHPAGQFGVAYDAPAQGWYAGAQVTSVRLQTQHGVQWLGYLGLSRRLAPDLNWDVGTNFTQYSGPHAFSYPEIYVGLTYKQVTARIYYANNYFHRGSPVVYAEINATHNLSERWYLFAHAGLFQRNANASLPSEQNQREDYRVGIGAWLGPCDAQLSWTGVHGPDYARYPVMMGTGRDAWVISFAYAW